MAGGIILGFIIGCLFTAFVCYIGMSYYLSYDNRE